MTAWGIDRRSLAFGLGASALAGAALAQGKPTPVVKTDSGPVRGLADRGVMSFKGVRYGAAPVGPLRFKPPVKPQAWTETFEAVRFGAPAMQLPAPNNVAPPATDLSRSLVDVFPSRQEVQSDSEDCLFLNVWTPALDAKKLRPVMVWFHGGGYAYGSGAWPMYDGANLAREGEVVVVTVNHRLNAFGYLNLAELAGPDYAQSGNAGILDLVLALQWVRDNARAFGGDPRNVTIFGESGGGAKVSTLMAMPAARGLFHRAIIQSGPGLRGVPAPAATATATAILAQLQIAPTDIARLQSVPADDIIKAVYAVQAQPDPARGQLAPVVDGTVLPSDPFTPAAPQISAHIPVMVGANKDEMTLFMASEPWFGKLTEEELTQRVAAMGPKGPALLAAVRKARPGYSPSHLMAAVASYQGILGGSITLADRKAEQRFGNVYAYRLDWETPVGGGVFKSPHTLEIPLVFDNVATNRALVGPGKDADRMASLMSGAWLSFVKTGDPRGPGLPAWPKYDTASRATMIFDLRPRVVNDPDAEIRQILQSA